MSAGPQKAHHWSAGKDWTYDEGDDDMDPAWFHDGCKSVDNQYGGFCEEQMQDRKVVAIVCLDCGDILDLSEAPDHG